MGAGNVSHPGPGTGSGPDNLGFHRTLSSSAANPLAPGVNQSHQQLLMHNQVAAAAAAAAAAAGRLPPGFERNNQGGLMPSGLPSHGQTPPPGITINPIYLLQLYYPTSYFNSKFALVLNNLTPNPQ